ncbi:MAG TPA: metallophosphoesterase family protein [Hyphomonadaceae bacterium]|nr:metallophosphoesterase family protein [Hyphomonadaceae bacterium]
MPEHLGTLGWRKLADMARLLRNDLMLTKTSAGALKEFGLSNPHQRIVAVATGIAQAVGDWLAALGSRIARVFSRKENEAVTKQVIIPGPPALVPPGRRVYAVGDVHGRADLLARLLDSINEDTAAGGFDGKPVLIFLGDYIDRGFQSKDVIDILLSEKMSSFETYFLKGNHEAAMLQFLHDPTIGPRWAEFGGVETLVSYGIRPPRMRTSTDEWALASQQLNDTLPPDHLSFLNNLDISVRVGDYVFVHAGVRPGVPLDQQTEQDMLWIRDDFLNDVRQLGAVIVHGHTPASKPHKDSRRVGIDTGAYLSGKLTAARFEHDAVEFISTGPRIDAVTAGKGSAGETR